MKKISLTIIIGFFLGIWILREVKARSNEPQNQLVQLLQNQGYKEIKITNSDFGFCSKLTQIPLRFQASINEKIIEGIACFSALGSASPRIQFKN